ncbi:hypothetical protein [Sphingobacterium sp.]|uniref:hypothetical protein n=1 Tax=Sphingobacterium sp. TaxID=341027 RepID=UPI002585100E|nr:hypothetical protein [Sphingobacterium sp.]WET69071.1 MAG: hypothetical protein P0Y57_24825 [Sphingobacterium sp.]
MEILSNLKTFSKILTDKGYEGLYSVKGGGLGSLEDVLTDQINKPSNKIRHQSYELVLRGTLKWSSEKNLRFDSIIWVRRMGSKFFLHKMKFEKRKGTGRLISSLEFNNLTVMTAPTIKRAIAQLQKQK